MAVVWAASWRAVASQPRDQPSCELCGFGPQLRTHLASAFTLTDGLALAPCASQRTPSTFPGRPGRRLRERGSGCGKPRKSRRARASWRQTAASCGSRRCSSCTATPAALGAAARAMPPGPARPCGGNAALRGRRRIRRLAGAPPAAGLAAPGPLRGAAGRGAGARRPKARCCWAAPKCCRRRRRRRRRRAARAGGRVGRLRRRRGRGRAPIDGVELPLEARDLLLLELDVLPQLLEALHRLRLAGRLVDLLLELVALAPSRAICASLFDSAVFSSSCFAWRARPPWCSAP